MPAGKQFSDYIERAVALTVSLLTVIPAATAQTLVPLETPPPLSGAGLRSPEGSPGTTADCDVSTLTQGKDDLRRAAKAGDPGAAQLYRQRLQRQATQLNRCRQSQWPRRQAIWLRLYPCDRDPALLAAVFDRIQDLGYNQVYVEVFFDGQVLLPAADNPTVWPAVVDTPGAERVDLLAEAIAAGRERGISVYAWLFSLNFGYHYSLRSERLSELARNGRNQTSLDLLPMSAQVFVDPYSAVARQDYQALIRAVLARRPDGLLFDYIRYPRPTGRDSVVQNVRDLLIYGPAARQAWLARAKGPEEQQLRLRFLDSGTLTAAEVRGALPALDRFTPELLKGVTPEERSGADLEGLVQQLRWNLWQAALDHARQGVIDWLTLAAAPAQQLGIATGAVFFPFGNQTVGQGGFDARLQPWDRFPAGIERHPMSYAICGDRADCILDEVKRVQGALPAGTLLQPALAGVPGQTYADHLPLEQQMAALAALPNRPDAVSHFAFAWMFPEWERQRQQCRNPRR